MRRLLMEGDSYARFQILAYGSIRFFLEAAFQELFGLCFDFFLFCETSHIENSINCSLVNLDIASPAGWRNRET